MTEELKISIEGLYSTFSRYPFRTNMEGCPCCVSEGDKQKLHSKKLRELEKEDISHYAFKAMTTWGDVDDFKHFLPRIYELLATTDPWLLDTFTALAKLGFAEWEKWSQKEQNSMRSFLLEWWTDIVKNESDHLPIIGFIRNYKLVGDMETLLGRWTINLEDNSFRNLVFFIDDEYSNLTDQRISSKLFDNFSLNTLMNWLKEKKEVLESGFFKFETTDPFFAQKISNALYMIERIQWTEK